MFANDISRNLTVTFKLSLALPLPVVTSQQRGRLSGSLSTIYFINKKLK